MRIRLIVILMDLDLEFELLISNILIQTVVLWSQAGGDRWTTANHKAV